MDIRPGRLEDHEAIGQLFLLADDLHAELLPRFFRRPRRTRAREDIARILRSPDEAIFVLAGAPGEAGEAGEVGDVAGLVHVQLFDTPPVPTMVQRRRAHVDSVVVRPDAQRKGHGRRLVEEAAAWARRKGAEELLLTVWAGNEAAERFYERLGFGRVNSVMGKPL